MVGFLFWVEVAPRASDASGHTQLMLGNLLRERERGERGDGKDRGI